MKLVQLLHQKRQVQYKQKASANDAMKTLILMFQSGAFGIVAHQYNALCVISTLYVDLTYNYHLLKLTNLIAHL